MWHCLAVARPMPEAAPVINTVFPDRENGLPIVLFLFYDVKEVLTILNSKVKARSNPEWIGRTIRENGKVLNSEDAISLTCSLIKQHIGIPLSKEEQLNLTALYII